MTQEQQQVITRHNNYGRLYSEAEKIVMKETGGDLNFMSQFCISTTKHSQALIVIKGFKDEFPYESYSGDAKNPWAIRGFPPQILKPEFFTQYWKNTLQVPEDWTICPFRVYEWNGNEWEECNLKVDLQNKVVRVRVGDQTFWSHPPRPFEVLENACGDNYKQKKGNLKKHLTSFQEVDTNSQIPEDLKPQRKSELKASIKQTFNEIYELVENLEWDDHNQLTSYRYPTFQMEIRTDQRPHGKIRFGNDSSGVYEVNSNEAHYRFEKEGIEPIAKPTKKELWVWVVESPDIKKQLALCVWTCMID